MNSDKQIEIIRSNRKTLALHIKPDGEILVKAPKFIPQKDIDSFIAKHQQWIDAKLYAIEMRLQNKRKENEYWYLGNRLTLTLGNYSHITVEGGELLLPLSLEFRKDKEIHAWYMREAKRIITQQVEKYAAEMQAPYTEITFSDTKSQWGRCTHDNRLQFSWRLVMAPIMVLNYVVIHELSHTFQKNHTQLFWMKVRNFNPSYRQQIKWLKEHGQSLHE